MKQEEQIEQWQHFLYLEPGGKKLKKYHVSSPPPIPHNHTRVVCISDTHNEQHKLKLPWGHVLVHAGDILTASGTRHVKRARVDGDGQHLPSARANGNNAEPVDPVPVDTQYGKQVITGVSDAGVQLVHRFAAWLGTLPHAHIAVIGGNHDEVLVGMGGDVVKSLFASHTNGRARYFLHEGASIRTSQGRSFNVFGSPHANWGGSNDAFWSEQFDYSDMINGAHVMITHMPAILPGDKGQKQREDKAVAHALHCNQSLLHVSGHCHWAHGLYHTTPPNASIKPVPCVVASVCEAAWRPGSSLLGEDGRPGAQGRADPFDKKEGGYNLYYPVIVCDLVVAGGPPDPNAYWVDAGHADAGAAMDITDERVHQIVPDNQHRRRELLFFGPDTDPDAVARLCPSLGLYFDVQLFPKASAAISAVRELAANGHHFDAAVLKLGSSGNLGVDVLRALREASARTVVVVHSSTALSNVKLQKELTANFSVAMFVDQASEDKMLDALPKLVVIASAGAGVSASSVLGGDRKKF